MKIYSKSRRTGNTNYTTVNQFSNDKSLLDAFEAVISKPGEWVNPGGFIKNLAKAAVDCGQAMPSDRELLLAALRAMEKRAKGGLKYGSPKPTDRITPSGITEWFHSSKDKLSTPRVVPCILGHIYKRRNGDITGPLEKFDYDRFISNAIVMNADGSHMYDHSEYRLDLVEDLGYVVWNG